MAYDLLSEATPRVVFIGSGTRGPFTFSDGGTPIRVRIASQLVVKRYSSTTDVDGELLVLDTDYTANVTDADNVTLTLTTAQAVLASTERLVVERTQPVAGVIEYASGGNFSGPTLSDAISVHSEQIQELRRDLDRSIRAHNLDSTVSTFPLKASATSGDLLAFDTDKNLTPVTPSSIGITAVNLGTGWGTVLALPAAGSLDNLSGVRFVATYAAMTALVTATGLSDNGIYFTYARATEEDGGAGFWRYDSSSTATADSGTILAADSGTGRFFRLIEDTIDPRWFGVKADGIRKTTGVATSGVATFTDASGAFASTDVGKTIVVLGAGAAGAALVTTIATYNSATSITLTVSPSTSVASNCEYKYGTNNDTAMALVRTYLSGQTRKSQVVWPAGFYLYTTSPNWAINELSMRFDGDVTLCCLSTSAANGFTIDSGATLASGYCWGMQITGAPKVEMLATGGHAVFMRGLLRSNVAIRARSSGLTKAAFRTDFCVGCDFTGCAISNNDQQPGGFANGATPTYGIQSTRRGVGENSAHNFWGRIIVEGTDTGVELDYSTGEVFEAGTIEGCTIGIHGTTNTVEPRFIDIDVEQNTVDLNDGGMINPIFDWYDADRAIRRTNKRFGGGHIYGLTLSNNGTDAVNDIDFAIGNCRDSTDKTDIYVHTGYTKRLDAAWAAGTNQGGLDTGAIANTTYHCFVILKDADGSYDFLFSASPTSPTMPSGYTYFRRIGSIVRAAATIRPFTQVGDEFLWLVELADVSAGGPSGDALYTLSVPTGIKVLAKISISCIDLTPAVRSYVQFVSPDQTDPASAAINKQDFLIPESGATVPSSGAIMKDLRTNTSGQVRGLVTTTTADHTLFVQTKGYIDTRGR